MKIQTKLALIAISSFCCVSQATAALAFPGTPFPNPFTTPNPNPTTPAELLEGVLDSSWTISGGRANADLHAFYADIAGYRGVGIGSLVNTYADVASSVSVTANTATVGVAGTTISDWFFQINAPVLVPGVRNEFGFNIAGTSGNLLAFEFDYNSGLMGWDVQVNGTAAGTIFENALYAVTAAFGAVDGITGTIKTFDGALTLPFSSSTPAFGADTFSSLTLTAGIAGAEWGDGALIVVPEPSSLILIAGLPAIFAFRRRR
jgi:hypothetical protein